MPKLASCVPLAIYQKAESIRFIRLKADVGNIDQATDQRLAALEERITRIDARLIEKGI